MRSAYDTTTIYAAEAALMATVPDGALMALASHGLADVIRDLLEPAGLRGRRVVILCGSGNNGGDALYAGAILCRRGLAVDAVTVSDRWHQGGAEALVAAGGRLVGADDALATSVVGAADVVVDGIVGIGAQGPVRPPATDLLAAIPPQAWVVAVDIPSGVDPTTGAVPDPSAAVTADVTVTFGAYKAGQFLPPGRDRCGILQLVDIGLAPALVGRDPALRVLDLADVAAVFAAPGEDDYKYSHGVLGVLAGCAQYPGAPHMVVGAARHAGVGMVRLWSDPAAPEVAAAVVTRFPDTVCTLTVPDDRATAWTVGPGLGVTDERAQLLSGLLASDAPLVVDADALTLVASSQDLRDALRQRSAPTAITPHVGEFARLGFEVGDDRVAAAQEAADDLNVIVVLKGPGTVIAAPGAVPFVDVMGTAALATAGTGDALSGLVGAALARRPEDPVRAVAAAVALHGLAGRVASRGDQPMTAWDLVAAVRPAVADARTG